MRNMLYTYFNSSLDPFSRLKVAGSSPRGGLVQDGSDNEKKSRAKTEGGGGQRSSGTGLARCGLGRGKVEKLPNGVVR